MSDPAARTAAEAGAVVAECMRRPLFARPGRSIVGRCVDRVVLTVYRIDAFVPRSKRVKLACRGMAAGVLVWLVDKDTVVFVAVAAMIAAVFAAPRAAVWCITRSDALVANVYSDIVAHPRARRFFRGQALSDLRSIAQCTDLSARARAFGGCAAVHRAAYEAVGRHRERIAHPDGGRDELAAASESNEPLVEMFRASAADHFGLSTAARRSADELCGSDTDSSATAVLVEAAVDGTSAAAVVAYLEITADL